MEDIFAIMCFTALGSFCLKAAIVWANQVIFLELAISNILILSITTPVCASHLADGFYARNPQNFQPGTSDCRFNAKARIVLEGKRALQQPPRTLPCGRTGYSHSLTVSSALCHFRLEYSSTLPNDSTLRLRLAISLRAHLERQRHPTLRRRHIPRCCSRPL